MNAIILNILKVFPQIMCMCMNGILFVTNGSINGATIDRYLCDLSIATITMTIMSATRLIDHIDYDNNNYDYVFIRD